MRAYKRSNPKQTRHFQVSLCTQHPFGSLSPYGHELIPLLQSMADNGGDLSAEKYAEVSGWVRGSHVGSLAKCTGGQEDVMVAGHHHRLLATRAFRAVALARALKRPAWRPVRTCMCVVASNRFTGIPSHGCVAKYYTCHAFMTLRKER